MRSRLISILSAVILLFTFTACGDRQTVTSEYYKYVQSSTEKISSGVTVSEDPVSTQATVSETSSEPSVQDASDAPTSEPVSAPPQSEPAPSRPTPVVPLSPFDGLKLNCKTAFVIDKSGQCIYSKGEMQSTVYPASITKLYTAHVALQYLQPTDVVTVGEERDLVNPDSSLAKISIGYVMTVDMLIEGMLLPSGNDAAYSVAAAAGRKILGNDGCSAADAVAAFVGQMNKMAIDEGLINSHFANPDGFHDKNHYSCMQDILTISNIAANTDEITKFTRLSKDTVTCLSGQTCTWTNTNLLIDPTSKYYREGVVGLKTGYTDNAGYCLISAEKTEDKAFVVGVFGCSKTNSRFDDTLLLLNAAHKV